jgi:hypothetical protein
LEETSYSGYVTSVGPAVFLSPGLTNESVRVVRMPLEGEGGGTKEEREVGRGLEVRGVQKEGRRECAGGPNPIIT